MAIVNESGVKWRYKNLEQNKTNIRDAYQYFNPNYRRFNFFKKFVFETSLSTSDKNSLASRGMPQLEFNILESMISKQRVEFAGHEPTLNVVPVENSESIDTQLIKTLEGHVRYIISDSNTDNLEYDIFSDQLAGGFSVMKIYTDYLHERSLDQKICVRRVFDPTLCGFDKMAVKSHKGDGMYCFELFPKTREDAERLYGSDITKKMRFSRALEGFNWSYQSDNGEEILLIADYYYKKIKKVKLVRLVTGQVMEERHYEKFAEDWNENSFIQAPVVIGKPVEKEIVTINHNIMTEYDIIEHNETDYKHLPLIFVDGNSVTLRSTENGSACQITRPYVYHALGIQRLKNYAGITLANDLENIVQHKFIVQKEAIPEEYMEAYKDVQKASVLTYNAFLEDDPAIPLQPPQAVPRVPLPPEVAATFSVSDEITRAILGNYDAALNSPNNNMLSGEAIAQGAMQSNMSSGTYMVSYLRAWNRAGEIILDLIPKYMSTSKSVPVKDLNGKRNFTDVNKEGAPQLNYDPTSLNIRIEAGVNFEIQRARSFEMLNRLMQTVPLFAEYITTDPNGIEMLLDNIDIRGIDSLKEGVAEFVNEKKKQIAEAQKMQQQQMQIQAQQAQQQLQMAQQNNPALIKKAELEQKQQKMMIDADQEQQKIDIEKIKVLEEIGLKQDANLLASEKVNAQNIRSEVDLKIKELDTKHTHAMDILTLHHNNKKNETTVSLTEG